MKLRKGTLILTLFILLLSKSHSLATSTTAFMSGLWTEAIWDNGIPGCYDTITIPAGIIVQITTTIDLTACGDSIQLHIYGRLEYTNGSRLKLPCGSDVYIHPGGSMGKSDPGGGSSTFLEICNNKAWTAGDGEQTGPTSLCDGGCPGLTPLPITLMSFNASYNSGDNQVELNWKTASEQDNDFFTIERSADGINWEKITEKDGAGNSTSTKSYEAVDREPLIGTAYYRLKQTDFNGDFTYSIPTQVNRELNELTVYPNPVSKGENFVIFSEEPLNQSDVIAVYSTTGELVYRVPSRALTFERNIIIHTSDLQAGIYLLKINDKTKKIYVQ